MSMKITLHAEKRKSVVEAIVIRQEPVHLATRIHHIPQRTVFDWLSLYRSGGWDPLLTVSFGRSERDHDNRCAHVHAI
jgi:hypothetical protein